MSQKTKHTTEVETLEDRVLATVFNFQDFMIRKFIYRDITILEVFGRLGPRFAKELERLAGQVRGNLGLDFAGTKNLQPAMLTPLKAIRRRFLLRKKHFILCNPPDKLLGLLKLNHLTQEFEITFGGPGTAKRPNEQVDRNESSEIKLPSVEETTTIASKEINHFNQSRKRTEHLEKGLDSASECIRKILPQHAPTLKDYEAGFYYQPSDKVGGDFFDFIRLEDDTLGITIGDVSGHGIDSAIVMGMAKKVIRLRAKADPRGSPAKILSQVNEDLFEDLGRSTFITALYANIDLKSGEVNFARAGHEPPFRFKLDEVEPASYEQSKGIALGMDPGPVFNKIIEAKSIVLSVGEGLLFYTDGIVESTNRRRDLFTRDRLGYILEKVNNVKSAESLITNIEDVINDFCEGVPPEDDMTALVVLRR